MPSWNSTRSLLRAYARDRTVVVRGDLASGSSISGERSLVVFGSVGGIPDAPCRIQMGEEVYILGRVRDAEISGESIRIEKGANRAAIV